MTRREFFKSVFQIGAAIAVSAYFIKNKILPSFTKATNLKKYPGSITKLPNNFTQGKWRG